MTAWFETSRILLSGSGLFSLFQCIFFATIGRAYFEVVWRGIRGSLASLRRLFYIT